MTQEDILDINLYSSLTAVLLLHCMLPRENIPCKSLVFV